MEKKVINVLGMSCSHCENAVKTAAGALPGVASVSVSLDAGTVTVEFDPEETELTEIKTAIEEEGFEVE